MISFIYIFLRIAQSASDAMVMGASLKVHMPSVDRLRSLYDGSKKFHETAKDVRTAPDLSPFRRLNKAFRSGQKI